MNMSKRLLWIPVLVVVVNVLAIVLRWASLPEILPAHFDLQGHASGTMSRSMLLVYPLIGVAVCAFAWIIARIKPRLRTGLTFLASGVCLILLSSTLVTLTSGTMPIFMLAEPVILLGAIVAFVVCVVKSRRDSTQK